jgi:hypothetical protein
MQFRQWKMPDLQFRIWPFKIKLADFSKLRHADRILIRYDCRHDPKAKKGGSEQPQGLLAYGKLNTSKS